MLERNRSRNIAYWVLVFGAAIVALLLRFPALWQDRPPYLFCDEGIYYSDALQMLQNGSWTSLEFRSGPLNVYPIVILIRLLSPLIQFTDVQVLYIGRFALPILLGAAAVAPIAQFVRTITGRRFWALIAVGFYLSSQMLLAVSRYWYPDHYLVFFTAIFALITSKILIAKGRIWLLSILAGISFAAGISVKYTMAVLIAPLLIAYFAWIRRRMNESNRSVFKLALAPVSALITTLLVLLLFHANTISHIDLFFEAQAYNSKNYGGISENPLQGMQAYSLVLFALMLGIPGILGVIAGVFTLVRVRKFTTLIFLLSGPILLVAVLGAQNLFINRNVVLAAPFVIALASIGIGTLIKRASGLKPTGKYLLYSFITLAFVSQCVLTAKAVFEDLSQDPSISAESWVRENISENAVVGTNTSCSGPSPASIAGSTVRNDPNMDLGLEYYVFDSYWSSAIVNNFRGANAANAFLDQKLIHFYYIDDKNLFKYFFNIFDTPQDQVPAGYELVKRFGTNGHEIWILKRI